MEGRPSILKPSSFYYDIYKYLWLTNKTRIKLPFNFKIPETVLLYDKIPVKWVFNSKSGHIKRKNKNKLNIEEIIRKFLNSSNDICAVFIFSSEENKEITVQDEHMMEIDSNAALMKEFLEKEGIKKKSEKLHENKLIFEFIDKKNLRNYLEKNTKRFAILQEYIDSMEDPNTSYKILWMKDFIKCEKKKSKDKKNSSNILSRTVTYESDKFNDLPENEVRSQITIDILDKSAYDIANHIESLYNKKISIKSLKLNFKYGKDQQYYLTYCTEIFFVEYSNEEKTISVLKGIKMQPEINFLYSSDSLHNQANLKQIIKCVNCSKNILISRCFEIPMKFFVKHNYVIRNQPEFSNQLNDVEELLNHVTPFLIMEPVASNLEFTRREIKIGIIRNKNSDIPVPIRKLHPKLDVQHFNSLARNDVFMSKTCLVCDYCFLLLKDVFNLTKYDLNAIKFETELKKNMHYPTNNYLSSNKEKSIAFDHKFTSFRESNFIKKKFENTLNKIRPFSTGKVIKPTKMENLKTSPFISKKPILNQPNSSLDHYKILSKFTKSNTMLSKDSYSLRKSFEYSNSKLNIKSTRVNSGTTQYRNLSGKQSTSYY